MDASYVVVTPVKDEERYIEHTLRSMVAQSLRPVCWLILDDGSQDRTADIVQAYALRHPWVRLIRSGKRGVRDPSGIQPKVSRALKLIRSLVRKEKVDYLVKLDGDLSFGREYFENLFQRFERNPRLGIAGGSCYKIAGNRSVLEKQPRFHVRGATKVYRKECWDAIGGMPPHRSFDIVDEVKANMIGWETRSFDELKVIHHKPTGHSVGSMFRWKIYQGRVAYHAHYYPPFMFFRCVRRIFNKPPIIGSLLMLFGFTSGYIAKLPRIVEQDVISYLREQQKRRLLLRRSIWK